MRGLILSLTAIFCMAAPQAFAVNCSEENQYPGCVYDLSYATDWALTALKSNTPMTKKCHALGVLSVRKLDYTKTLENDLAFQISNFPSYDCSQGILNEEEMIHSLEALKEVLQLELIRIRHLKRAAKE